MAQQYRYNRYNRNSVLNSAYTTIGEKAAESLGIMKNQDSSFNFQHIKDLEDVTGNIVVMDLVASTNSSENDSGTWNYGAFLGKAGLNLMGRPTLQSTIPCIVVPDRKRNTDQRTAVRESFATLAKLHGKGMVRMEVNPASVHLFQETSTKDGSTKSLVVIEAAGIFGADTKGKAFFWSILQYPLEDFQPATEEEAPRSNRGRSRSSKPAPTGPSEEQGSHADAERMAGVSV